MIGSSINLHSGPMEPVPTLKDIERSGPEMKASWLSLISARRYATRFRSVHRSAFLASIDLARDADSVPEQLNNRVQVTAARISQSSQTLQLGEGAKARGSFMPWVVRPFALSRLKKPMRDVRQS